MNIQPQSFSGRLFTHDLLENENHVVLGYEKGQIAIADIRQTRSVW
jgi:hypothetical protein